MSSRQVAPGAAAAPVTFDNPYPVAPPLDGTRTENYLFRFDADRNAWIHDPVSFPQFDLPMVIVINTPEFVVQDLEAQFLAIGRYQFDPIFQEYLKILSFAQYERDLDNLGNPELSLENADLNGSQLLVIDRRLANDGFQGENLSVVR